MELSLCFKGFLIMLLVKKFKCLNDKKAMMATPHPKSTPPSKSPAPSAPETTSSPNSPKTSKPGHKLPRTSSNSLAMSSWASTKSNHPKFWPPTVANMMRTTPDVGKNLTLTVYSIERYESAYVGSKKEWLNRKPSPVLQQQKYEKNVLWGMEGVCG